MTEQITATSSADRSRRYRQRQRDGWLVLPVPIHEAYIDALVDQHFLEEADANDRQKITEAIGLFLFVLAEGAISIDGDQFS